VACIVVVSHDSSFVESARGILEAADGHHVLSFDSTSSSVDDILGGKPEVLIVDLADGERDAGSWDGLKLRTVQAVATRPVILCTSDGDGVGQRAAAFQRPGPVFTLSKPLQAENVLHAVRQAAHALR
jgi:FixJ family two-component response regulator